MNDLDLQNVPDASGNGRGLTLGGKAVPSFAADPFGIGQNGVVFNASAFAAGPGALWTPPSSYTFRFRIKRTTANNGTTQMIFGRWGTAYLSSAYVNRYQFLCYWDTGNKLNFIHSTNLSTGSGTTVQSAAITDGNAHEIEISNNAGQLSLYVDGTRVAGPTAAGTIAVAPDDLDFGVGIYSDQDGASAGSIPLYATFGDFEYANVARHTGSSYSVSGAPYVADGNTLALLRFNRVAGQYLEGPVFQRNVLTRTGYTQASGGWANPDGPLPQIGGGYFFSVSGYDGTNWTCWAVTAATIDDLFAGSGTMGALAIQTPTGSENGLSANGTVIAFGGTYYHYYHDAASPPVVRYSTGSNLGAPFSPQPGTSLFTGYADPWVRPYGSGLIMYLIKNAGPSGNATVRDVYTSTSSDGTTWSTPAMIIQDMRHAGWKHFTGEISVSEEFNGSPTFGFVDGAKASTGEGRKVMRSATRDRTTWYKLGEFITPSGSDSGGNPYVAAYDTSCFYDAANNRLAVMTTHSTNTQPTQPTDSDIGLWFARVLGDPIASKLVASRIAVARASAY